MSAFRYCAKLYIPENIDFLFDIETIKDTEQKLRSAIQKVEVAVSVREKTLEELLTVVDDAKKQLDVYSDLLIKSVTQLKQNTQARLDSISNELESVLFEQSKVLNMGVATAKDVLQKVTHANTKSNNKSQQFTCSNLAAITAQNCEAAISSFECPDLREILFEPHVTCEDFLNLVFKNNSLGDFFLQPWPKENACVLYTILKKTTTRIKEISDNTRYCDVTGSCTLQDETILLADYNNASLKRILPGFKSESDSLKLSGDVWSVAVINQNEVAVTLPDQKQVMIIALDTKMKTKRTLKLDFVCRGITHYNNELFISSDKTVYVYTLAGKVLGQFSADKRGHTYATWQQVKMAACCL